MSDLISRQGAIRWVKTECNPYGKPTLDFESGKRVIEHLEQMPSADRPTGEWWIREYEYFTCSECGYDYWNDCDCTEEAEERLRNGDYPNYCPNCGAEIEYRIPLDDDTCE